MERLELKNIEQKDAYYEEAIKTLRTNLQFSGSGLKVILVTSTIPNEGKSDIAFFTAAAMGSIGKKTLLIDADIRKSVLMKRHEISGNPAGLSQYLSGLKEQEEIIYRTNQKYMDLILSGPYSPNPAELLSEELLDRLLEKCREEYDYIFIDTPPMANIIDGAIIANRCDGAMIVVKSGAVSYRMVQRVKAQLEKSSCRILGAVLNQVGREYESERYAKYYKKYYKKNGKGNR